MAMHRPNDNRHRLRATSATPAWSATVALAAGLLAGCAEPPPDPPKKNIEPPVSSPNSIPDGPLNGTLNNKPFSAKDARFYVDNRDHYEKIEIKLTATEVDDHCGTLRYAEAPMVWLRRRGNGPIEPGTFNIKPGDDSPWEIHYQVKEGDHWVGNGDAAALIVFRSASLRQSIIADLAVCFADAGESCVSGSFVAHYCPISVDLPVRGADSVEALPDAGAALQPMPNSDAGAPDADGGTEMEPPDGGKKDATQ